MCQCWTGTRIYLSPQLAWLLYLEETTRRNLLEVCTEWERELGQWAEGLGHRHTADGLQSEGLRAGWGEGREHGAGAPHHSVGVLARPPVHKTHLQTF